MHCINGGGLSVFDLPALCPFFILLFTNMSFVSLIYLKFFFFFRVEQLCHAFISLYDKLFYSRYFK